MPYIKKKYRAFYDSEIATLSTTLQNSDYPTGHMTYIVFKLVIVWFMHTPGYEVIRSIRGMLAGVLSEFDRKYAFPYEEKKIRKNGDVTASIEVVQQGKLQYHVCACCVDELRGDTK